MNKKIKTLLSDTFVFALGSIGSKAILFFLVPLYTNKLTRSEYGVADLVLTIGQIIIPIVSMVIFDAVIRFGLEKHTSPESVLKMSVLVWVVGSVITLIIIPMTNFYPRISPWKWYMYLYIVCNIFLSIELNYIKVKRRNLLYSTACIIQTLSLASLNIILLVAFDTGITGYILSNIIACVIAGLFIFFYARIYKDLQIGATDFALLERMLKYSVPLIFNNMAWWIIQSSDRLMIQLLVTDVALGLYTVATRIPSLISVVVSVFQQSWGISAVVEMESDNDKNFYSKVFNIYTLFILFSCIALNSIIKYFMKIYVAEAYYPAWHYVPMLIAAAGFSAVAAYFGSIYGALKKSMNNMISTVFSAIINILINICLIPHIGVWGAVIGTLVSYCFLSVYRMWDCLRFVDIRIDLIRFISNTILVTLHSIILSIDFHTVATSILVIIIFGIINYRLIITGKEQIIALISKRFKAQRS